MIKNKFINYLQRLWYLMLWKYVAIGFRFYFRKWQIVNRPKMKRLEPVIYVSNHQNAFLDAMAIVFSQNRHPIFLTRANIFASPIVRFFLRSFNMLPIYRSRDGVDSLSKNDRIIQDCIDMLSDGRQPMAIFTEGNHSMRRALRSFKKGLGRIAFSAIEQQNFKMKLKVVPIGITYSKHSRARSNLLVNFGEPILVNDYLDIYHENANKAYVELNKELYSRISDLIIDISDTANYEEIEKAWISEHVNFDNLVEELHNDQKIIARLIKEKEEGKTLAIKPFPKKKRPFLGWVMGFPAFIYGTLNHLPFLFLMQRILGKIITDIHFYGSIKIAVGAFLGGIIYLLQAWGLYSLTSGNLWIAGIYFVSLPFFGIFAYDYYLKYYTDEPSITSSAALLKGYK